MRFWKNARATVYAYEAVLSPSLRIEQCKFNCLAEAKTSSSIIGAYAYSSTRIFPEVAARPASSRIVNHALTST